MVFVQNLISISSEMLKRIKKDILNKKRKYIKNNKTSKKRKKNTFCQIFLKQHLFGKYF